jgi:hypothetical protein
VEVDEAYTLNPDNTKKDRYIQAIAWWSQEQMRLARRFVSRRLVESDATLIQTSDIYFYSTSSVLIILAKPSPFCKCSTSLNQLELFALL